MGGLEKIVSVFKALKGKGVSLLGLILTFVFFIASSASEASKLPEYRLDVIIDVETSSLTGRAELYFPLSQELVLSLSELIIRDISLDNRPVDFANKEVLRLVVNKGSRLVIHYGAIFKGSNSNIIDDRGIALRGVWYPHAEGRFIYKLKANLPNGYIALSEAERVKKDKHMGKELYDFHFPYPLYDSDGISLIASKDFVVNHELFDGIEIYTYLLPTEAHLSKTFIEHTKRYLKRYNRLLGRYPYRRLSIVEHFDSAGYSLPTYVFLGKEDFKLPIEKTPLGHEIVHQWFGNYVFTDYDHGNWNEGFTIYFADHLQEELNGMGWKCRRRILSGFKSHVKRDIDFPLADFTERYDLISRSIGYGKSAMVVHMLRRIAGDKAFYRAIRDFVMQNRFRVATWRDIQRAFEHSTKMELGWFFDQWVYDTGTPELSLSLVKIQEQRGRYDIEFSINQRETDFRMPVNVSFHTEKGAMRQTFWVERQADRFTVSLNDKPKKMVLDEDYDLFRILNTDEDPPTLERLLTDNERLLILPKKKKGMYSEIVIFFEKKGPATFLNYMRSGRAPRKVLIDKDRRYQRPDQFQSARGYFAQKEINEIDKDAMRDRSFIILDINNPLVAEMGIKTKEIKGDAPLYMQIIRHPFSPDKVVAIVNASERVRSVDDFEKVFDYPFYSTYEIKDGIVKKSLRETTRGIVYFLDRWAFESSQKQED